MKHPYYQKLTKMIHKQKKLLKFNSKYDDYYVGIIRGIEDSRRQFRLFMRQNQQNKLKKI